MTKATALPTALPTAQTRVQTFVMHHLLYGCYLGELLGAACWSNLGHQGIEAAHGFTNAQSAWDLLSRWQGHSPEKTANGRIEVVPVMALDPSQPTIAECRAADLPGWEPDETLPRRWSYRLINKQGMSFILTREKEYTFDELEAIERQLTWL